MGGNESLSLLSHSGVRALAPSKKKKKKTKKKKTKKKKKKKKKKKTKNLERRNYEIFPRLVPQLFEKMIMEGLVKHVSRGRASVGCQRQLDEALRFEGFYVGVC